MTAREIGEPLTGSYSIPGGEARLHAGGLTISGPGLELRAFFELPPIGRPSIVAGDLRSKPVFAIEIAAAGDGWSVATLPLLINDAIAGRVELVPTAVVGEHVPLTITSQAVASTEPGFIVVEASAPSM